MLYGFLDLKLYRKLQKKESELKEASTVYIEKQMQQKSQELKSYTINQWTALLIAWCVLAFSAHLVSAGSLDGVFLAMMVLIALGVFDTSTPMTEAPIYYEDSRSALRRLFSVSSEDVNAEQVQKRKNKHMIWTEDRVCPSISVQKVSFCFQGDARPALEELTIHIPPGSKTAIVGPSGSGKSTFLALLLKLCQKYDGDIIIGEQKLNEIEEDTYWQGLNPVLQTNHFFYGTVRENLQLASSSASDKEMTEALSNVKLNQLCLDDRIFEKGVEWMKKKGYFYKMKQIEKNVFLA